MKQTIFLQENQHVGKKASLEPFSLWLTTIGLAHLRFRWGLYGVSRCMAAVWGWKVKQQCPTGVLRKVLLPYLWLCTRHCMDCICTLTGSVAEVAFFKEPWWGDAALLSAPPLMLPSSFHSSSPLLLLLIPRFRKETRRGAEKEVYSRRESLASVSNVSPLPLLCSSFSDPGNGRRRSFVGGSWCAPSIWHKALHVLGP